MADYHDSGSSWLLFRDPYHVENMACNSFDRNRVVRIPLMVT